VFDKFVKKVDKEIEAADFSDDEKHDYKESFQKTVDTTNRDLESTFDAKETSVMSI